MTTIVGIQHENKCVIFSDNQTTGGDGRKFNHAKMVKISKRGDFLIGGSGEAMPCDVAQHIWEPPTPTTKDLRDPYHFMISKVVPSLRKCLVDNGFNFDEDADGETRFDFLIAVAGHLFSVADDLSVGMRDDGIYGVGSGSKYAIGAIMAGATPLEAMRIAASQDAWTSGPFMKKEQYKTA
jgi:ATP-dependent protease HslVU (ClpYQ) peptidase subunit